MTNEEYDEPATYNEAMREYARNVGGNRPDSPYILTDYDVWVTNPHYRGPKCIASIHPEASFDYDEDVAFFDLHAECRGHARCLHGFGAPVYGPRYDPYYAGRVGGDDDDLPF